MKQNTLQILLWLYPVNFSNDPLQAQRLVETQELKIVLPDINEASLRSLLFLLTKNGLVENLNIESKKYLHITKEGISQLEAQFPALKLARQTISHWTVLIFLEPPKTDPNFRYLRRFLLDKKLIQLTRGVYLSALSLDNQIMSLLEKLYKNNILVLETEKILLSDVSRVIGSKINLSDAIRVLSGISKEIDALTGFKSIQKGFSDKQKIQFASIFSRLSSAIEQGYCLEKYFFPQVSSTLELLGKLKKTISI